jgi:hypothetical protein
MHISSTINVETFLVCFVGYTVSDFATKHHLITSHEIKHNIFQFWHECFFVDFVEINLIIRSDLNSYITFNIVNEPSNLFLMVLDPLSLISLIILFNFKEQDVAGASGNEG